MRHDDEERERQARVRVHQEQQEKKAQVQSPLSLTHSLSFSLTHTLTQSRPLFFSLSRQAGVLPMQVEARAREDMEKRAAEEVTPHS